MHTVNHITITGSRVLHTFLHTVCQTVKDSVVLLCCFVWGTYTMTYKACISPIELPLTWPHHYLITDFTCDFFKKTIVYLFT